VPTRTAHLVGSAHAVDEAHGRPVTRQAFSPVRRGRAPMLPTPDVAPSPLWSDALEGFELHLMSLGRSGTQLRNRLYSVRITSPACSPGTPPSWARCPAIEPSVTHMTWQSAGLPDQERCRSRPWPG